MARASALCFFRPLAILAVSGLAIPLSGCGLNNIPTYEQNAKAAWSDVLNQYKRRADLIANLLESKDVAEQERAVLKEVVDTRAKATQVQAQIPPDILTNPEAMQRLQKAQSALGGVLARLLGVVQVQPDIRSGQNFASLRSQLESTQNRIALARRDCLDAVRVYNSELTTTRGRWWRALMYPSAKEMAMFDIAADEMKTPKADTGTQQ